MLIAKILALWTSAGVICGVVIALTEEFIVCIPRGVFKPFETKFWSVVYGVEYGVIGLILGTIVLLMTWRSVSSPKLLRLHAAVATGLLIFVVVIGTAFMVYAPPYSCALP